MTALDYLLTVAIALLLFIFSTVFTVQLIRKKQKVNIFRNIFFGAFSVFFCTMIYLGHLDKNSLTIKINTIIFFPPVIMGLTLLILTLISLKKYKK